MKGKGAEYCANCAHCIVVRQKEFDTPLYRLRVRCEKGMWKKSTGEEKFHKYFTVVRRIEPGCPHYQPLGETEAFLKELRKELPPRDEFYHLE